MIGDVPASAPFVHRSSAGSAGPVEIWSVTRLPFEPKGWLVELRAATARLVAGLEPAPGQVLHAVYRSAVIDAVDAENVLLYNVGLGTFHSVTRGGLRFERAFGECPVADDGGPYAHHYRYAMARQDASFHCWRPETTIARWQNVATPPLHETAPCAPIWLAVRRSPLEVRSTLQPGQRFGMRIVVRPGNTGGCAAAFVKPLLDGVVAALHRHDGRDLADISDRLAMQLGVSTQEVAGLLTPHEPSPLGTRRLLWLRARGVQWNPGDDQCVAAEVLVEGPSESGEWSHSGELFTVTSVNED